MLYYEDLKPFPFDSGDAAEKFRAVGWLDREHPYNRGEIDSDIARKLGQLLRDPWQPAESPGFAPCELCRLSKGPFEITFSDMTIKVGTRRIYVPGEGVIYVAPSMILHFIDAHEYCPPSAFQDAVRRCGEMRSMAYFKQLIKNAPKGFVSMAKG